MYDWRDDHAKNPDFEENILNRGTPDPRHYEYPFQSEGCGWVYSHPAAYSQKNLGEVLQSVKRVDALTNEYRVDQP